MAGKLFLALIALAAVGALLWLVARVANSDPAAVAENDAAPDALHGQPHERAPLSDESSQPTDTREATPQALSASGRALEVRVLDENAKPFFGIEVDLELLDAEQKHLGHVGDAMTAADGICTLAWGDVRDAGRAHELLISVEEPNGYVDFDLRVSAERERADLQLVLGSHVFGSARYSDGPIAAAQARLTAHWRIDDQRFGVADADVRQGEFDFERGLAGSIERVELETPHTPPAVVDYSARGGLALPAREHFELELVFAPSASTIELTFLDAATLVPVEGMRAFRELDSGLASDASGRLRLVRFLAPNTSTRLRFSDLAKKYAPVRVQITGPDPVREITREVLLERALSLSGIVIDLRGVPQSGVTVRCEQGVRPTAAPGSTIYDLRMQTPTDSSGRFALYGLPARGELQVSFLRSSDDPSVEHVVGFEVVSMPEAAARETWLVPDLVAIAGTVLDADEHAVAGAHVTASASAASAWRTAETDANGQFRIDDALPGTWSIAVDFGEPRSFGERNLQCRQRAALSIDVGTAGTTHAQLRLPRVRGEWPSRSVRLRAIDASTRAGLDGVEFVLWGGIDHSLSLVHGNPSLADGGFVELLPIGRSEVIVRTPDYATARQLVDIVEGDGDQLVLLALLPLE